MKIAIIGFGNMGQTYANSFMSSGFVGASDILILNKTKMEEKGLINKPIYLEHIERENGEIDTQKSLDEAIKNVSEKYDKMFKDRNRQITANGFVPQFQPSVQPKEGSKSAAELYKERMQAEGKLPKAE